MAVKIDDKKKGSRWATPLSLTKPKPKRMKNFEF